MMMNVDKRINTAKIKLFCATRWVESHLVLEEIIALYEPLLTTLQKIATENGWDCKTMAPSEPGGLFNKLFSKYVK